MPTQILMPALSPTMTEGNLAKWHKKPGDNVRAGDVIAEIETDKATMEVEAVDEGTIAEILIPEGAQAVKVNTPIASLLFEGESKADLAKLGAAKPTATTPANTSAPAAPAAAPKAVPVPAAASSATQKTPASNERVFASPLAKRIAEQNNVNLSAVQGTGPHGRIVKADVEAAGKGGGAAPSRTPSFAPMATPTVNPAAQANALGQLYTVQPNSNVRKIIARRLLEAKQTIPHFYLTVDIKLDKLLDMRQQLNSLDGMKISVNDLVIKAVARALKQVPAANASWSEDGIILYEHADVSVAVATPNGLVTPIVKQAEYKSIAQISAEMKDLAARARDNKLKPEEFQGGGFTISNLGMFGVKSFSAIINPPQSCILAVGAGEKRAVVGEGDKLEVATVMSCTLSVDHRSVDGAVGAEFLAAFKQFIESPLLMLV